MERGRREEGREGGRKEGREGERKDEGDQVSTGRSQSDR